MGLLSIFQRQSGDKARSTGSEPSTDTVQEARARARRRLIGATVLVIIGVIGFPLVFETQPRQIPVDIPIVVPRKDAMPPLVLPQSRASEPKAQPTSNAAASAPEQVITETQAETGREVPTPDAAEAPKTPKTPVATVAPVAPEPPPPKSKPPEAKPVPPSAAPTKHAAANPAPVHAADGQRAAALLDGKTGDAPSKAADGGRFVVQVGAFADANAARETRQKIEKLGLKTYTQVAETPAGHRTRVRVGPFATREEALKAQARIKAAGSPAVVLTL